MERAIEQRMAEWKQSNHRKPLIIKGARQVGKTYTIRKFAAEHYRECVEINFEKNLRMAAFFEKTRDPKEILAYLEVTYMEHEFNSELLLFLDEIQACPSALTALKFLAEEFPCDIICSGSMLGIAIAKSTSFPVGYVETWEMYPMSFLEFLQASGLKKEMLKLISGTWTQLSAIPSAVHERMNEYFTTYLILGGMPEVIARYLEMKSLKQCLNIQRRIVNDYHNDMAKYANAQDKVKVRECFSSIPHQLAKENKKFQYSVIQKGYNARYYDSSLRWLEDSGLILKVNRLKQIAYPLSAYAELPIFKVYMADVGLFISGLGDGEIQKIIDGDLGIYKGVLYENITAQIFKRYGKVCYYYEPNQFSEIDFIIEYEGNMAPIEVKGGKHTASKAFMNFVRKQNPKKAFRFSLKNVGISQDGQILYLPLYLLESVLAHETAIDFHEYK